MISPRPPTNDVLTFGVLGPLEVRAGPDVIDVHGPQERALLALLLTEPGVVVAMSAIVAGIWGEDPPADGRKTVQSYVSRLRRTLPDNGSGLLLTRSPGYLAAVEPARVDAERFRTMVGCGRHDLTAGRHEDAAGTLREALGLWRGEAYAEFDAPFAVVERTALEELRLAALEDRMAAGLAGGAGPELVGELEGLVARHPWRERLWAQLMTALYRAGRQGDALGAFRRAREALVDELGVEPGPDLRAIEAMVLAQDIRLTTPVPASTALRLAPPIAGPGMVGRDTELARLLEAYDRAATGIVVRVLVTGPHGMGKTLLLAELAREAQKRAGIVRAGTPEQVAATPEWSPRATPLVVVVDDLHRARPADLTALAQSVLSAPPPLLLVGACVPEALSTPQQIAVEALFADRMALPPLRIDDLDEVVRLYVSDEDVADAVEAVTGADGVPLHVHAAASRFAEQRAAAEIGSAAARISQPRHQLATSQEQVADGVVKLQKVRLLRTAAHAPRVADQVLCPYKGLAFFDVDDAPYFFGRERLIARLVARLVDAPLLAVVGASGSGKSSVVRAGLVAAVRGGSLPQSAAWHTVVTTPAQRPPDLPSRGTRTLLVVDQFEELFTAVSSTRQAEYAEWLVTAAATDDVSVVVALRSDYFGRASAHPGLADLLAANTVLVGEMTPTELSQAVSLPAAAAGLELDPGLAETVADDVAGQPGALPLLSTALLSLWERREGRRLSLAAYRELGGVRTAVAQLAEGAYERLTPRQQIGARRVLLQLAEVGEGGVPVRRRVSLPELAPDGDHDARVVLDTLAAKRLLTVSATHAEVAHEALLREWPRLRGWLDEDESGRLLRRHLMPAAAEWRRGGGDVGELYRGARLTAALDWAQQHPEDLTELEHGFVRASQQAAGAEAAQRRRSIRRLRGLSLGLTLVLTVALVTGWLAVDQRDAAERSADAATSSALQADVRALRAAALNEPRWDLALLYAAQAQQLDPSTESQATLLQTVQRSPEATTFIGAEQRLLGVATSADGSTLAALGSEGTAYVWDTESGKRIATVPDLAIVGTTSFDLSPDGRYLSIVGVPFADEPEEQLFDKRLVVADIADATPTAHYLPGPALSAARFAADGRHVVTVGVDGQVRTVDVRTGAARRQPRTVLAGGTTADLTGTANRRYLVSAFANRPGPVTAWEVDSGHVVWSSRERSGSVAAISPDGSGLVLAHGDGAVEYIDLAAGHARRSVPSGPFGRLVHVDWAPDGSTFAGATYDGTVVVWDADTLQPGRVLRGHSGTVSQVVYSRDGASLYASGFDRSVLGWDLTGTEGVVESVGVPPVAGSFGASLAADGSLATTLRGFKHLQLLEVPTGATSELDVPMRAGFGAGAVEPHGRYVAIVDLEWPSTPRATVHVVDVASSSLLPYTVPLRPHRSVDVALTADGQSLLTSDDRRLVLRDVRTGRPVTTRAPYRSRDMAGFIGVDAHGHSAALLGDRGVVEIANLTTGRRETMLEPPLGENLSYTQPRFSPDGRWLAIGWDSGLVVLWDTRSWKVQDSWIAVRDGGVSSLAFTPDSRSLLVGGGGTASVWNIAESQAGATLQVDPLRAGAAVAVAARNHGATIATFTTDTGVQLWDMAPEHLLDQACEVAGRSLTQAEWDEVLPDRPYERTCPQ